jgi:hypothetical protein
MTNMIPEYAGKLVEATGEQVPSIVLRDPIPWGGLFLLGLWMVSIIIITIGITRGIARRRNGLTTAPLSQKVLIVSTCLLFIGSANIIWRISTGLAGIIEAGAESLSIITAFHLMVYSVAAELRFLAINITLSGLGFIVAILLHEKRQ